MNLHIDFGLIIALLVLAQLFILNMGEKEKRDGKKEKMIEYLGVSGADIINMSQSKSTCTSNSISISEGEMGFLMKEHENVDLSEFEELSLVVHRNNGDEKIYRKSDVA